MSKTAMQEFEEAIENLSSLTDTNKFVLKSLMINFKIKEKQQIIDAYTTGAFDLFHEICNHSNCTLKAEQYYNLKFKDNETDPK